MFNIDYDMLLLLSLKLIQAYLNLTMTTEISSELLRGALRQTLHLLFPLSSQRPLGST